MAKLIGSLILTFILAGPRGWSPTITPARRVILLLLLAVGVMGCSETETKESLVAERLKRCERLNVEVGAKQVLGDLRRGGGQSQFQQDLCRPAGGADPMDHLHHTLVALAASFPKSGTCSVHGPFFICEATESELFPTLHRLTGVESRGRHYVLYRAERARGWQTAVIPSDSVLLAEWSRQIRLLPDTIDPRGPKGAAR